MCLHGRLLFSSFSQGQNIYLTSLCHSLVRLSQLSTNGEFYFQIDRYVYFIINS